MNRLEALKEKKKKLELELEQVNDQMEMSSTVEAPSMLTIREASREVGLSYNYIRSLCRNGSIVSIRVGNRTLVNREKLIAFLNSGREGKHDT